MTEREILQKLKSLRAETNKQIEKTEEEKAIIKRNKDEWLTFWRRNINLYIKYKLQCNTYPFQAISYYLMSQATKYDELSSRGTSKTFKFGVFDIGVMLLYPNTEIVVTSSTFSQSCILIEDKVKKELFDRDDISPVIHYLYKQGYFEISNKDQKVIVRCTLNNSTLTAVGCVESSRGLRCNILEYDERILLKDGLINSIFKPMRRPRQSGYLNRPEYQNENKYLYLEQPKTLSISSNRFTQESAHQEYVKTFKDSFEHPDKGSYVCSWDIFTAMKHGIKTKDMFLEDRKFLDEISFKTEICNCPISEVDGAFFKLNLFRENQVLTQCFRPPTRDEYIKGSWSFREKQEGEIRVVFGDLAFTGDVKGKSAPDLTVLGCLSIIKPKDRWFVNVEYIKTLSGGDPNTALRMRELIYWYDADYLIYDNRNGGDCFQNIMSSEMHHPYIPDDMWNYHGLTVSEKDDLQFCSTSVLQEIKNRTVDPSAIPMIIPMKATDQINDDMWRNFYNMLKNNQVNFLIDDLDFQQEVESTKEWMNMDSEDKAIRRLPYLETRFLIDEAINLKSGVSGLKIKLEEPRNKTKDRCVAVGYGLLLTQRLINRAERNAQQTEFDINDWQIVF